MSQAESVRDVLRRVLASQRYAVLATDSAGQPYTSLMAFAASDDLREFTLITERGTHKYANLRANPRVALFIDNRENVGTDTRDAVAVTALGEAQEVDGEEGARLRRGYVARHPYLESFAGSASSAVLRVRLKSCLVVRRFEEVLEWRPDD
ncbi:pyridoxamine 5'-phosphate oxidase family protein [Accumulibacter sp.]|uniref:pyridoxamine 5'-phosphate oxidase family protein n=1 Tax=Accumulibacter sp. TaxID=2053492 RepID=UPI0025DCFCA7|nr:pyridoxamine 5'-phosphate oxidase family protein [Accumulibacter sp.]MCM8612852.1 pyridoxamine 5'-phosphate oxidase family protein [Accumulibacter sp.]MCM8636788.1 pyridoxamine 5'-phosphate oxidase family protein [Accumulibacter sp.]MCM8641954.1 pyridoxamine 5'-phosphate oxidase family protein [Accumulibacter sp.]